MLGEGGEKEERRQRGIHVRERTGRDNTRKTALPRCYYEKINFQPERLATSEKYRDVSHFQWHSAKPHSTYETTQRPFRAVKVQNERLLCDACHYDV